MREESDDSEHLKSFASKHGLALSAVAEIIKELVANKTVIDYAVKLGDKLERSKRQKAAKDTGKSTGKSGLSETPQSSTKMTMAMKKTKKKKLQLKKKTKAMLKTQKKMQEQKQKPC